MDKFLTFEGEQPIWLDDFNFIDASIRDTFKKLVVAMSRNEEGNVILYGCSVSPAGFMTKWTEGIVSIDGEILPVTAGQVSGNISTDSLYFSIINDFDSAGNRILKNGEERQCYNIRKAIFKRHI